MGWQSDARAAAEKNGINPDVFVALVRQESGGRQGAVSPVGAIGRTQLMPATAKSLGVDPRNAQQNLDGGARYLKQQLQTFGGNYRKALAAYNAGPGAVQKYGGVPPYAETQNYVKSILGSTSPTSSAAVKTTTIPGVDNRAARASAFLGYLGDDKTRNSPTGFLDLASTLKSLKDVAPTTKSVTSAPAASAMAGDLKSQLISRANTIDAKHLPYSRGGGHASKVAPSNAAPLDCSGAVSAVLGINPRVSGQFATWGSAGEGSGKGVVIYSNSQHVLMKINGHFFGTSGSNPGGGAGWIPQAQISPEYLKRFTARHAAAAA